MSAEIPRPKVLVTRGIPPKALETLQEACEVWMWPNEETIPRDELLKRVNGVHAVFCHPPTRIDGELCAAAGPQLKVVSTMSVGLDHIDLTECQKRGIKVGHTPNVLTEAVADMALGLTLAAARRYKEGFSAVTDGGWGTWDNATYLCGQEISGSTVGIVGLGRIGLAVAKRLRGFGLDRLLYCGHSRKEYDSEVGATYVSFQDLLQQSDFVIATCSISESNQGLFNASAFCQMKKTAVFVNVSRGVLVHQSDLYEALANGRLFSAALDVTTPEPINKDNPLLTLKNCIITPHIASATFVARGGMAKLAVRNLFAGLRGEPLPSPACKN